MYPTRPSSARSASRERPNSANRDRTFSSGVESHTLPHIRQPRQRQMRALRPKSGSVTLGDTLENNFSSSFITHPLLDANQYKRLNGNGTPHWKQGSNRQVLSVRPALDRWSTGGSFRSQLSYNGSIAETEDQADKTLNGSVYLDHSYSTNHVDSAQYLGASIKSLPESSQGSHGAKSPSPAREEMFKSMPGIHNDKNYGVFGDDDDDDMDETLYHPSASNHDSMSRKLQMLGINQRSRSHGDMLEDGSGSPTQHDIALSLAKSLTDEKLNEVDLSQLVSSRPRAEAGNHNLTKMVNGYNPHNNSFSSSGSASSQKSSGQRSNKPRPRSATRPPVVAEHPPNRQRPKSAVYPNTAAKARDGSAWNKGAWNKPAADTTLVNSPQMNTTVSCMGMGSIDRRNHGKKKKKSKGQNVLENLNVTTVEGNKKKGIRDSLKNIFFKRR